MRFTPGFRCADAARDRTDPMIGTAPPARRWLLLESPGNWLPQAFEGWALEPRIKAVVQHAADATRTRILLVRRPGRPAEDPGPPSWIIVDPFARQTVQRGHWSGEDELLAVTSRLGAAAASGPADSDDLSPPGQLLLVCTHGRHDVCCAVRGRPVAAALAQRWPEETWECSHVGGDRFAANVISLPDGAMYGGLDPQSAVQVIGEHHGGRPDPAYLRGICGHPPVVQAAVAALLPGLAPGQWRQVEPTRVQHSESGGWRVDLRLPDGSTSSVTGREVAAPAHRLTCAVAAPHRATSHVVDRVFPPGRE